MIPLCGDQNPFFFYRRVSVSTLPSLGYGLRPQDSRVTREKITMRQLNNVSQLRPFASNCSLILQYHTNFYY